MKSQQLSLFRTLWAILVFADLILLVGHEVELYLPDVELWIKSMGVFAPLGFIALFVVMSPVFVSVDVLCFAAGVLFPLVTGELAVAIATYTAAAIMFFLGRDFLRGRVQALIAGDQRFAALAETISGDNAFRLMFLLRLTPLPFALLSYALSVTQVRFRPYLAATTGILIYNGSLVYFGYATKHLTGLASGSSRTVVVPHTMLVLGSFILIAVLIFVAKIAGNALKEMNRENPVD